MPFTKLPQRFLMEVILRTTILIISLPRKGGVHPALSCREIITRKKFRVPQHEIGDYVQAHTVPNVSNDTGEERTVDALYLGPLDNGNGHDVFKLSTKQKISARKVTLIPMISDIIERVNIMGKEEGEPDGLEFTVLFGNITIHDIELGPDPRGMFDDDDSKISDADFTIDKAGINKEIAAEEALDDDDTFYDAQKDSDSNTEDSEVDSDSDTEDSEVDDSEHNSEVDDSEHNTENPEVRKTNQRTNDETEENFEEKTDEVLEDEEELEAEVEENVNMLMDNLKGSQMRYEVSNYNTPGTYWSDVDGMGTDGSDMILAMIRNYSDLEPIETAETYPITKPKTSHEPILSASKSTPQYYYTKGIKIFEDAGYEATKQELDENLIGRNCVEVLPMNEVNEDIKEKALNYLMFLKRKRCRKIKARGCADGRKQREYISKDESSSPTVSNYALMCSCLMSAIERRHVVTCDIPGAFLQTDWPDELDDYYIHFETLMVHMICDINPEYKKHVVCTNNRRQRHLYAKVKKAVY